MNRRPTLRDLARAAGVSHATVDRVLNKRSKVREATAQRVLLAAEDIGYHATGLLKRRVLESHERFSITVLLQKNADHFYRSLESAFADISTDITFLHLDLKVRYMGEVTPACIADAIYEATQATDAIAVVALDHTLVRDAIQAAETLGKPVVTLISNFIEPQHCGHVGMDGHKIGRSAAWTISRLAHQRPGEVGILLGSHRYRNQQLSESSFVRYFKENDTGLTVLPPLLDLDDDSLAADATAQLLDLHPDLVAVYNIGGGMQGMIETLHAHPAARDLVVVCNELSPPTIAALQAGYVDLLICTPVASVARQALEILSETLRRRKNPEHQAIYIQAHLAIAENL